MKNNYNKNRLDVITINEIKILRKYANIVKLYILFYFYMIKS